MQPHIAILGGGLAGTGAAIELAERGCTVTLYEKNPALLSEASGLCEGKIHLGFVYANDPTERTLPLMLRGALSFKPLLTRWLGATALDGLVSAPFYYVAPRTSALTVAQLDAHFATLARLGHTLGWQTRYIAPIQVGYRRLTAHEQHALFDADTTLAAYASEECALDAVGLAQRLRERAAATPRLQLRCNTWVESVTETGARLRVSSQQQGQRQQADYDQVINALWTDRLRVDGTLRPALAQPAYYRHKTGFFCPSTVTPSNLASITFVHGPFGDIVRWRQHSYFSWYPAGMRRAYRGVSPPPFPPDTPAQQAELIQRTLSALAQYYPALRPLTLTPTQCQCVGGEIVAWGQSDISDATSELHQRHAVGVHSHGRYHSIDTGKYTLAPLWSWVVAERICPTGEAL